MIANTIAVGLFLAILVRCAHVVNSLRFADRGGRSWIAWEAVSYTHLTLPTNREV